MTLQPGEKGKTHKGSKGRSKGTWKDGDGEGGKAKCKGKGQGPLTGCIICGGTHFARGCPKTFRIGHRGPNEVCWRPRWCRCSAR